VNPPLKLNPRRDPHKPTRFSHAIHLSEAVGYDEYPERTERMRERLVAKLHFLIIAQPTLASFTLHRKNDGMEGGKEIRTFPSTTPVERPLHPFSLPRPAK
jgi:hypothetical protein